MTKKTTVSVRSRKNAQLISDDKIRQIVVIGYEIAGNVKFGTLIFYNININFTHVLLRIILFL